MSFKSVFGYIHIFSIKQIRLDHPSFISFHVVSELLSLHLLYATNSTPLNPLPPQHPRIPSTPLTPNLQQRLLTLLDNRIIPPLIRTHPRRHIRNRQRPVEHLAIRLVRRNRIADP